MNPVPAITLADEVRQWLSVFLGPLVTFLGFAFIYRQLKISGQQANTAAQTYKLSVEAAQRATAQAAEAQNWKKAEFLANQVKDFYGDKTVEKVTYMLDWHQREVILSDASDTKVLAVHDDAAHSEAESQLVLRTEFFDKGRVVIIAGALRTHDGSAPFSELEVLVRDNFDWFFFRLGQFQHMIQSGLFSYREVDIHLSYVLDLISGGLDNVSPQVTQAISGYIVRYDFPAIATLAKCRTDFRNAAKARTK